MVSNFANNFITANWPAPANIKTIITTKFGGVSTSPFMQLNLAEHVNDKPQNVADNRHILQKHLPTTKQPIWLQQTHSVVVVNANAVLTKPPLADASFSTVKNTVCAVLTADCLPVLFTNQSGTMVAAAHAGWRGLSTGILETTVSKFTNKSEEILAWLGPAIGKNSFEVGSEVRDVFVQHNPATKFAFIAKTNNKFLADIYLLATIRLNAIGVNKIYGGGFDTFTDDRFYSFRQQPITGRMASLIWL